MDRWTATGSTHDSAPARNTGWYNRPPGGNVVSNKYMYIPMAVCKNKTLLAMYIFLVLYAHVEREDIQLWGILWQIQSFKVLSHSHEL